jgi:hypothetical protein
MVHGSLVSAITTQLAPCSSANRSIAALTAGPGSRAWAETTLGTASVETASAASVRR